MNILGIDTATPICSVGLVGDGRLVADYRLLRGYSHAEKLPTIVKKVMEDGDMDYSEIGAIAVSIGPGSFTGLRIGLSFAKGLSFGWGIPLVAVPTMDGLMSAMPHFCQWACVLLIARKNEFYRGLYQWSKEQWELVGTPHIVSEEHVFTELPNEDLIFLGEGALAIQSKIQLQKKRLVNFENFNYPTGYGIAKKGYQLFLQGEISDPEQLVPFYIKRFQNVA